MTETTDQTAPTAPVTVTQEIAIPLVVVGGGLSGLCAAIAAARRGVGVALVQERPVLGGNSSSEIRVHPVGASQHGANRDARETGLIEEIFLDVRSRSYGLRQVNGQHYPMWDVVLAEKAEDEPNLRLFLDTRVIGVETAPDDRDGYERRVTALVAAQQGTEAVYRFVPETVIDATGDGFIALQAGAPFRYGREARSEFGERWAPEEADDVVLGSTIMFAARDVGRPARSSRRPGPTASRTRIPCRSASTSSSRAATGGWSGADVSIRSPTTRRSGGSSTPPSSASGTTSRTTAPSPASGSGRPTGRWTGSATRPASARAADSRATIS